MCNTCLQHRKKKFAGEILSAAKCNAQRMVKSGLIRSSDEQDFASELAVKILKRIERWDAERLPIHVFIGLCVKRESISLMRTRKFNLKTFASDLNLEAFIEKHSENILHGVICREWDGFDDCPPHAKDVSIDVTAAMSTLAEAERRFLELLHDRGFRNAASISGMTRGDAARLLRQMKQALDGHAKKKN